jgi:hypothetical protein
MADNFNCIDFQRDGVVWYHDDTTGELVNQCLGCGSEEKIPKGAASWSLLDHAAWCPCQLREGEVPKHHPEQTLSERAMDCLKNAGGHPDDRLLLSMLASVVAAECNRCSARHYSPVTVWVRVFQQELEWHLHALATSERNEEEVADRAEFEREMRGRRENESGRRESGDE